jgi:hypothetical protein
MSGLSDIEPLFVCHACDKRGADVRPDFESELRPRRAINDASALRGADHPCRKARRSQPHAPIVRHLVATATEVERDMPKLMIAQQAGKCNWLFFAH